MQNVTKLVPMINGVEVKVGQKWKNRDGMVVEITSITDDQYCILGDDEISRDLNGIWLTGYEYYCDLVEIIIDSEESITRSENQKEQVFTRSELSALIEVNSYEIKYLTGRVNLNQEHAKIYYNLCDKAVKETSPYFVKLNDTRNAIKKYKAKRKKLVAVQVKLKQMYNSSK